MNFTFRIPQWLTRWLLRSLTARAKRAPYFHLAGYMNRWWLVPYTEAGSVTDIGCGPVSPWRRPLAWVMQRLGFAARIHEILRSDRDRVLHDHPWPYLAIILKGGYYEVTEENSLAWYRPGSVLVRGIEHRHRLMLPTAPFGEQPATTLFITGRYAQKWGFFTPEGKVPYDEYLAAKHVAASPVKPAPKPPQKKRRPARPAGKEQRP